MVRLRHEAPNKGEFPSGQRGQTVNLLRFASMVRIRPPPPFKNLILLLWKHSSAGRASALQAEGHRFDPCCFHQIRFIGSMAEQLICNQQVAGSSPITSSNFFKVNTGGFPSGQRGQTVNLLRLASMVRIHLPPPAKRHFSLWKNVFFHLYKFLEEFAI